MVNVTLQICKACGVSAVSSASCDSNRGQAVYMAHDVFLSYARDDTDKAVLIRNALEALGLNVFFDTLNLDAGDVFPEKLEREIEAAGAVVGCWTNHALTRDWVLKECNLARAQSKLIPLEMETLDEEVMTVAYSKIDRADLRAFTGDTSHPGFIKLVRALERRLGKEDLLKLAEQRARDARKAEAERLKERERLAKAEARAASLEKRKGGLRTWQIGLISAVTVLLVGGAGYWGWQQQQSREALMTYLGSPEWRSVSDRMAGFDNDAPDALKELEAILIDIDVAKLERASDLDARAALLAGWAHGLGAGGLEVDQTIAAELYQKACDLQNMRGCRNLGNRYDLGTGVDEDDIKANALFEQACNGGDMGGCRNLGWQYAEGEGADKDQARANTLFKQACDGGYMSGCNSLGLQYDNGDGLDEQDDPAANVLYRQACEGGDMAGCRNLGWQFAQGEGVTQNNMQANLLFEQACDGGDMPGCTNVGFQFAEGNTADGERDYIRANGFYRVACEGGEASGCANLAFHHAEGLGTAPNLKEAIRFSQLACDGGYAEACEYTDKLQAQLDDSPPPPP